MSDEIEGLSHPAIASFDIDDWHASVCVGEIARPPWWLGGVGGLAAGGIYCACLPRPSGEWGVQWNRGDFYVGLASVYQSRLIETHHKWYEIRDARAVFVAVDYQRHNGDERRLLRELEGCIERALSERVTTTNAAATHYRWRDGMKDIADATVEACLALRAEVLG